MLKKSLLVIILFFQFFIISFAYSDNTIENLEYSKYGKIYSNEDFGTRLRRLEMDILGMSQSGDINSRIAKLQKVAGVGKYSAIMPPDDNFYPGEKKSVIRKFFDNVTSSFYDPESITGYTPSITNNGYYYDSSYNNGFFNRYNNYYPYNRRYLGYNNPFYNNNRYFRNNWPNRNKISSILPSMNTNNIINMNNRFPNRLHKPYKPYRPYRPYRPNMSYSPYNPYNPYNRNSLLPTDMSTNIATRSSVHILQD